METQVLVVIGDKTFLF